METSKKAVICLCSVSKSGLVTSLSLRAALGSWLEPCVSLLKACLSQLQHLSASLVMRTTGWPEMYWCERPERLSILQAFLFQAFLGLWTLLTGYLAYGNPGDEGVTEVVDWGLWCTYLASSPSLTEKRASVAPGPSVCKCVGGPLCWASLCHFWNWAAPMLTVPSDNAWICSSFPYGFRASFCCCTNQEGSEFLSLQTFSVLGKGVWPELMEESWK